MEADPAGEPDASPAPHGRRILVALGITQILAWGTSFYLLTVLAAPIAEDTGWPLTFIVGGFSAALLVSGLAAPKVGRLIARHGGRGVLAGGAALMGAGLALLGLSSTLPVFIAGWLVIGLAMSASLYDPAFSTLGSLYGRAARRPITMLTLFGGFASTVCWPLSAWLVEIVGWRGTCLTYAAIQIGLSLPLLLTCLPRKSPAPPPAQGTAARPAGSPDLSRRGRTMFLLLAAALVIAGIIAATMSVHLIALLDARGVALAAAVSMGMLIGPSQVGGRLFEIAFGRHYHPIRTLTAAAILGATGILLLYSGLAMPALALVFYGSGLGIWTIARGALPLALFGPGDYPVLMGRLAMPTLVAQALAPLAGAFLIDRGGAEGIFIMVAALAAANLCVVLTLAILHARWGDVS